MIGRVTQSTFEHPAEQDQVRRLLADLDSGDSETAEEAQAELETYGASILGPLMEAAPHFGRLGTLCAVELFAKIGDRRASSALIPMLQNEDDAVRQWAAEALGQLGAHEAIPNLKDAYNAARRATNPDWSEPATMRTALATLGARREVIPARVAAFALNDPQLGRCWRPSDLRELVEELAAAGQVVVSFAFWRWRRLSPLKIFGVTLIEASEQWTSVDTPSWDLQWSLPWSALVDSARRKALEATGRVRAPENTVAVLSWIDEADR